MGNQPSTPAPPNFSSSFLSGTKLTSSPHVTDLHSLHCPPPHPPSSSTTTKPSTDYLLTTATRQPWSQCDNDVNADLIDAVIGRKRNYIHSLVRLSELLSPTDVPTTLAKGAADPASPVAPASTDDTTTSPANSPSNADATSSSMGPPTAQHSLLQNRFDLLTLLHHALQSERLAATDPAVTGVNLAITVLPDVDRTPESAIQELSLRLTICALDSLLLKPEYNAGAGAPPPHSHSPPPHVSAIFNSFITTIQSTLLTTPLSSLSAANLAPSLHSLNTFTMKLLAADTISTDMKVQCVTVQAIVAKCVGTVGAVFGVAIVCHKYLPKELGTEGMEWPGVARRHVYAYHGAGQGGKDGGNEANDKVVKYGTGNHGTLVGSVVSSISNVGAKLHCVKPRDYDGAAMLKVVNEGGVDVREHASESAGIVAHYDVGTNLPVTDVGEGWAYVGEGFVRIKEEAATATAETPLPTPSSGNDNNGNAYMSDYDDDNRYGEEEDSDEEEDSESDQDSRYDDETLSQQSSSPSLDPPAATPTPAPTADASNSPPPPPLPRVYFFRQLTSRTTLPLTPHTLSPRFSSSYLAVLPPNVSNKLHIVDASILPYGAVGVFNDEEADVVALDWVENTKTMSNFAATDHGTIISPPVLSIYPNQPSTAAAFLPPALSHTLPTPVTNNITLTFIKGKTIEFIGLHLPHDTPASLKITASVSSTTDGELAYESIPASPSPSSSPGARPPTTYLLALPAPTATTAITLTLSAPADVLGVFAYGEHSATPPAVVDAGIGMASDGARLWFVSASTPPSSAANSPPPPTPLLAPSTSTDSTTSSPSPSPAPPPPSSSPPLTLTLTSTDPADLNRVLSTTVLQPSSLKVHLLKYGFSMHTNGHFTTITLTNLTTSVSSFDVPPLGRPLLPTTLWYYKFSNSTGVEVASGSTDFSENGKKDDVFAPTSTAYGYRNNEIYAFSPPATLFRYGCTSIQPRHPPLFPRDSPPLTQYDKLSSQCTLTRLAALDNLSSPEATSARILLHLDRLSEPFSPPLLSMADEENLMNVEISVDGEKEVASFTIQGVTYKTNSEKPGWHFMVLPDAPSFNDDGTHDKPPPSFFQLDPSEIPEFVDKLPHNSIVLVALAGGDSKTMSETQNPRTLDSLLSIGANRQILAKLKQQDAYSLIGVKGATAAQAAQERVARHKGAAVVRGTTPTQSIPLCVDPTPATFKALIKLLLTYKADLIADVVDPLANPASFSMLLSTIRVLTSNIYQLLKGTPTGTAVKMFKKKQADSLRHLLLECSVNPPKSEILSFSLLRLLKSSLHLFWPTTQSRCDVLIGYLGKYADNNLRGHEQELLQMLMTQLSKPAVITDLLNQTSKSDSAGSDLLIDSLLNITVKEWKLVCTKLVSDSEVASTASSRKTEIGTASLNMLATLTNHVISLAAENVISMTDKPASKPASKAASSPATSPPPATNSNTLPPPPDAAVSVDHVVPPVPPPQTPPAPPSAFSELTSLCTKFVSMSTDITSFALDAFAEKNPDLQYIDSDLEQLIRSPLTSLLPNLIFSINLIVDTYGTVNIKELPALSAALLPMVDSIGKVIKSIPPSRMKTTSSQTDSMVKKVLTFESKHPYMPYTDETIEIKIPGAASMTITFDGKTKTEHSYDYVKFYKDRELTKLWSSDKFSGGKDGDPHWPGHPGSSDVPPLVISADVCYMVWKSDGSNEDWGWLMNVTADVKSKAGGAEAHWLASLDLYATALVSSICNKLIVGPKWIEGTEDSSSGWLGDSLFAGARQQILPLKKGSIQSFEAKFLNQLIDRKKPLPNAAQLEALKATVAEPPEKGDDSTPSLKAINPQLAEVLIYKMRRRIVEDQGNDESINDAVYATCAALLWARNITSDAIRFAKSLDASPSAELTKAWRLAQKMRQYFTLSDIASANTTLPTTLAPPGLERGDSLYQGADEKVVNEASLKIIEKAKYLTSLPPPASTHEHETTADKFKHAAKLALTRQTSFNSDRWKRAVGEVQEGTKLSRLLEWRRVAAERRKQGGVRSVSERVLSFLQSEIKVQSLTEVREKRDERATLRCAGLTLLTKVLEQSSTLSSKAWAVASFQALAQTRRETEKTHFFNGVEGSSSDLRRKLKESYFGAMVTALTALEMATETNEVHYKNQASASLHSSDDARGSLYLDAAEDEEEDDAASTASTASSASEEDDEANKRSQKALEEERVRFTVSCLRSISMDYDYTDHGALAETKILPVLSQLLSSHDTEIRTVAWEVFEVLLARGVGMEGQPLEATENISRWTSHLLSLLENQLQDAVDAVLASKSGQNFDFSEAKQFLAPEEKLTIVSDAINLDSRYPGKVAKHVDLRLRNTVSLWIKRRPTEFDAVYQPGLLKEGWRVTRSEEHPAVEKAKKAVTSAAGSGNNANHDEGEDESEGSGSAASKRANKLERLRAECGTVMAVKTGGEVEVRWDGATKTEICRFGKMVTSLNPTDEMGALPTTEATGADGSDNESDQAAAQLTRTLSGSDLVAEPVFGGASDFAVLDDEVNNLVIFLDEDDGREVTFYFEPRNGGELHMSPTEQGPIRHLLYDEEEGELQHESVSVVIPERDRDRVVPILAALARRCSGLRVEGFPAAPSRTTAAVRATFAFGGIGGREVTNPNPTLPEIVAETFVAETVVDSVQFTDTDGDKIEYRAIGDFFGLSYTVNGDEQGDVSRLVYNDGGLNDDGGFMTVPLEERERVVAQLGALARRCNVAVVEGFPVSVAAWNGPTEASPGGPGSGGQRGSRKVFDLVAINEEAAGIIYWKGVTPPAQDDSGHSKSLPWSTLKLQLNNQTKVGFCAAQGGDNLWIKVNGGTRIPYDEWTHVAVVQNSERCFLYVNGELDGEHEIPSSMADTSSRKTKDHVLESPHPYNNNSDDTHKVAVEGAIGYTVTFDNKSVTEKTFDFLRFWKDESKSEWWGEEKYCGGMDGSEGNWPGVDDLPALKIDAPTFLVSFKSDASNNDWGWKLYATPIFPEKELELDAPDLARLDSGDSARTSAPALSPSPTPSTPIPDDDVANELLPNNISPIYFGNLPQGYSPTGPEHEYLIKGSFDGFISRMEVYSDCLNSNDIKSMMEQRPIMTPIISESSLCLDVLCMVLRCAKSGVMTTSAALVTAPVLKALIILSRFGEIDVRVSATRVLQFVMPLAKPLVVDVQSKIAMTMIPSSSAAPSAESFVKQLMLEVGSCCNSFYSDSRPTVAGAISVEYSRRERLAICNEQVKLLRALMGNHDFAEQLLGVFTTIANKYPEMKATLLGLLKTEVDTNTVITQTDAVNVSDIDLMFATFEVLGGGFSESLLGSTGMCRLKSKDATIEECVVIGEIAPPSAKDIEKLSADEKQGWSDLENFGDGLVVAMASGKDHGAKHVGAVVPLSSVVVESEPLPAFLTEAIAADETSRKALVTVLGQVLETTCDLRRKPLDVVVKEEDAVVEVESDHPHLDHTQMHKVLTFKGSESIEISFTNETRTAVAGAREAGSAYVCFYKDESHSTKYGEDRYFGGRDGNWPGVGGRPPLVIPNSSVHIYFHSETSNVDYGFKLIAKAHTIEKIFPPAVPPPVSEMLLMSWRAAAMKSLYGLVGAASAGASSERGSVSGVSGNILGDDCAVLCQALIKESLRVPPKSVRKGGGSRNVVKESAHPYTHNMNSLEEHFFKGAKKLTITFDTKSSTENGADYVCFYKDQSRSEMYGEKYTGGKDGCSSNWPGCYGRPPLVIPGNKFTLLFRTDGSVNDWGWKFTIKVESDEVDLNSMSLHEMTSGFDYALSCLKEGYGGQDYPALEEIEKFVVVEESGGGEGGATEGMAAAAANLSALGLVTMDSEKGEGKGGEGEAERGGGKENISQDNVVKFKASVGVSVMSSPSLSNGSMIASLPASSIVAASGEDGDWLFVRLPVGVGGTSSGGPSPAIKAVLPPHLKAAEEDGGIFGWVLRRAGDTEYLVLNGMQAEEEGRGGGEEAGAISLDEDMVALLFPNGVDGEGGDDDGGGQDGGDKAKHPALRVADSCKLEATSDIADNFGYIVSEGMKGQLDGLGAFCRDTSHLLSIRYAQMALTAMIPLMSLDAQFDMDNVEDMIEFLRIVFLQQKDSFNSAPLEIIKKKIVGLLSAKNSNETGAAAKLCTHSLNVLRGKMMIDKILPPFKAIHKTVETAHEYENNEDKYYRVNIPNATSLRLVFDPRTSTEADCDRITIHKGGARGTVLGGPYSGREGSSDKNFPGVNKPPLEIKGNDIEVHFYSDSSNTDWGFLLNVYGIVSEPSVKDLAKFKAETKKAGCTAESVEFSCWLLSLLANNMESKEGKCVKDVLSSAGGLRILRKFLLFCRGKETKGKVVSIVNDIFHAQAGGEVGEVKGDNHEELGALGKLVIKEAETQYQQESSRAGKTEYLQSLVECSVAAVSMSHEEVSLSSGYGMQWLQNVIECSSLLNSFDPRSLPQQLIVKELLPKIGKDSAVSVESAHPFDGRAFSQEWGFEATEPEKVEVVFDDETRMAEGDVIVVESVGEAGGEVVYRRELRGLSSGTLKIGEKDKLDSDLEGKIFVGDLVARGKDWKWGGQDKGGEGIVLGVESWKGAAKAAVRVQWKGGEGETPFEGVYRSGYKGVHDLVSIGVSHKSLQPVVVPGCRVKVTVVSKGGEEGRKDGGREKQDALKGELVLDGGFELPYNNKVELNEDFTVEFWIKPREGSVGAQCLLDRSASLDFDGSMTLRQMQLMVVWAGEGGVGDLTLNMGNAEMGTGVELSKSRGLKSGVWSHIAVAVSGSSVALLVNGNVASRGDFDGSRLGAPMESSLSVGKSSQGEAKFSGWLHDLKISGGGKAEGEVRGGMHEGYEGDLMKTKYLVAFRFNSASSVVANTGGGGGAGCAFGGGVVVDLDVAGVGEMSQEVWGWKMVLKPIWGIASVPKADILKLKREFLCGGLAHDEALVKYANEVCLKKSLDTTQILRVSWDDISPVSEDLTRSPKLRELALLSVGGGGEGEGGEGGGEAEKEKGVIGIKPIVARWRLIQMMNRALHSALPLIDLNKADRERSMSHLVSKLRRLIFRSIKVPIWQKALQETANKGDSQFELKMSRSRAAKFIRQQQCDVEGRWSCFGQAFRQMHSIAPSTLRRNNQLYFTIFMGERAHDAGGPYRETFCEYAAEVQSTALPLMLPSPNGRHTIGMNRDAWVPNPGGEGAGGTKGDMYTFLGKIFGICLRSEDYLSLCLPSIVWKKLCGEACNLGDLEAIDSSFVKSMESMRNIEDEGVTKETFGDIIFETFETLSVDDRKISLGGAGGSEREVTWENREEWVELATKYRMGEFDKQVAAILRGFACIVPVRMLVLFSWEEVAEMVCGSPFVDVELLKSATEYSGCGQDDRHVKLFWQCLREFTNEERQAFLRFCWSRSRLPLNKASFPQRFKLQSFNHSPADQHFPIAHTCFFSLEWPQYTSLDIAKEKLRYAIFNCSAIDGDDTDVGIAAANMGFEDE